MAHLVQILLPLADNQNIPFPIAEFERVRDELALKFGGVTAHIQSPAKGLWKSPSCLMEMHDDIVMFDVMVMQGFDRDYWTSYRHELTHRFRQECVIVRATEVELL